MQNPGPANKLHPKTALGEIARVFLRPGFIAFGGPAAHMALMEEEFVRRRAWVTRERFLDLVGAVSLLPGPSSTELAIYLGQIRGGVLGLILAGAAFILPAAFLVVALAWACARFGTAPQLAGLLGVKPAVVVLIAQAIWSLAKTALRTAPLALLAAAVIVLSAFGVSALVLLIGAGAVWMVAGSRWPRRAHGFRRLAVRPSESGEPSCSGARRGLRTARFLLSREFGLGHCRSRRGWRALQHFSLI